MNISGLRSILYTAARLLGDAQAVDKSIRTGSPAPLVNRVGRKMLGRAFGFLMGRMPK